MSRRLLSLLLVLCLLGVAHCQEAAQPAGGDAAAAPAPDAPAPAPDAAGADAAASQPTGGEASPAAEPSAAAGSEVPEPNAGATPPPAEPAQGAEKELDLGSEPPLASNAAPDPLDLGPVPTPAKAPPAAPSVFSTLSNAENSVTPPIVKEPRDGLKLGVARRIEQTERLLNNMVWQLNRETAWANSVHDIISNYQYKYTKVLSNIKKHSDATQKMRDLLTVLKKARLHEILESDLRRATDELNELATTSSSTGEDDGSYAALKDRTNLIAQDLQKMSAQKVHAAVHEAVTKNKEAADAELPPPSSDTLKDLGISA